MYKIITVLFLSLFITMQINARILPKEGSKLHYRLIGFSFPDEPQNGKYKLEIADGYFNQADSFKKNIINSTTGKKNKIIAEVPAFGKQYTWRVVFAGGNEASGTLHHFSTTIIPFADTNVTRLRITKRAEKNKDAYVFLDGARALYDMNGRPVWYLPDIEGLMNESTLLCDLKITNRGTITFMLRDRCAFEINYNSDVIWRGPNNSILSKYIHYHHEFTRLSNGHYMILGTEPLLWKHRQPAADDSSLYVFSDGKTGPENKDTAYKMFPFGTMIEYDEKGNVVWEWKTSEYVKECDLKYYAPPNGGNGFDVHVNAFFFDEKDKTIYLSFRDINRIIKIKYPEGTVLNTYGERYKRGFSETGKGLFCGQHSCRRSEKGYLYLYNNNVCSKDGSLPNIIMMQEAVSENGNLNKVWEYECTLDGLNEKTLPGAGYTSGGNVIEMPDHSLFVSMSSPYGKIFMVSPGKDILWSAVSEQWNRYEKKWQMLPLYRASIINSRNDLEHLIWNEEIKE